jgi:hypothetical protein
VRRLFQLWTGRGRRSGARAVGVLRTLQHGTTQLVMVIGECDSRGVASGVRDQERCEKAKVGAPGTRYWIGKLENLCTR